MYLHGESQFIQEALGVTAQFGYLRKEFFWKYLSAPSRSAKFRAWSLLMKTGYLKNYDRPVIADDVYKLSKLGFRVLREAGMNPVRPNHPLHMEHDDIAVHFALSNSKKGLIEKEWHSEKKLKQWDQGMKKHPDLLFYTKIHGKSFSCALEVERTRKDKNRYSDFVLDYSKAKDIQLIVVAHQHESVKKFIQASAASWRLRSDQAFVFFKIKDLSSRFSVESITEQLRTLSPTEFSHFGLGMSRLLPGMIWRF